MPCQAFKSRRPECRCLEGNVLLPYCRPYPPSPVAIAGRGLELEELNATVLVRVGHLERV